MKRVRPVPETRIHMFKLDLKETDLSSIIDETDPEKTDSMLLGKLNDLVDLNFSWENCEAESNGQRFFSTELKQIDRQLKREFSKRGKTDKYFRLRTLYKEQYEKASKAYLRNNVDRLLNSKPGMAHSVLKYLGARPSEDSDMNFFQLSEF